MTRRKLDELPQDQAAWLLASFCALHRVSFDASLFAQRYPPPIALSSFSQAANELDLAFEQRQCGLETALGWRLPLALQLTPAQAESGEDTGAVWALALNADEYRVILLEHGGGSPVALDIAALKQRYLGAALSLTPKAAEAIDPDGIDKRQARFGLHWFGPELLKHKKSGAMC